jgi:hypothetical protein
VYFTTFRQNFSPRLASSPELTGDAHWEIEDGRITFSQEYAAKVIDDSSGEPIMLLKAKYELLLYTEGEYSEEFALEYSTRQLHVMVRPYFRELIANMAPRALLTVPPVPTQFITPREIIEYPAPKPDNLKSLESSQKNATSPEKD